ncbi:hypothetical protein, partial [Neisseria weaveri]|uniref:hypothetical protein n=1 Tax=Neisseria weaveri TaxID=28091 RepID=UPI0019D36C97
IGYLRGIKGIFRTENSRNPVFGFRLLGKGAILQRSRPLSYHKPNIDISHNTQQSLPNGSNT